MRQSCYQRVPQTAGPASQLGAGKAEETTWGLTLAVFVRALEVTVEAAAPMATRARMDARTMSCIMSKPLK